MGGILVNLRKFLLAAAIAALAVSQAFAAELPEVDGWTCGPMRETQLDAVSGNHGQWLEREYRTANGAKFLAVWMEGAGPALWKPVTEVGENCETSGGESAEKISVAGYDAILESRPVLGLSLVVKLGKDGVLTLESQSADKDELARAAETLIGQMKAADAAQ